MLWKLLLCILIGYLLGSIPFSYLCGRLFAHEDVRNIGSGNVGATNVIRAAGKKVGILAFIGDFLKGLVATLIGRELLGLDGAVICGIAAVIGHCYSVFLQFTGGKGVATSAGAVGGVLPAALVLGFPLFGLVMFLTGYVSLGSMSVYVGAFILAFILDAAVEVKAMTFLLGCLVFYRHGANICRLYHGEEPKVKRYFKHFIE